MSTMLHDTATSQRAVQGTPTGKTRLRITPRGRAVVTFLVAAPIVAGAFIFALNGGGAVATSAGSSEPLQSVTVLSGQSLWELAEELAPNSDPREFIADLVKLNTLTSADVRPGQSLDIPAEYVTASASLR